MAPLLKPLPRFLVTQNSTPGLWGPSLPPQAALTASPHLGLASWSSHSNHCPQPQATAAAGPSSWIEHPSVSPSFKAIQRSPAPGSPPVPHVGRTWPVPPLGHQRTPSFWLWVPRVPVCVPQGVRSTWGQDPSHRRPPPLVTLSSSHQELNGGLSDAQPKPTRGAKGPGTPRHPSGTRPQGGGGGRLGPTPGHRAHPPPAAVSVFPLSGRTLRGPSEPQLVFIASRLKKGPGIFLERRGKKNIFFPDPTRGLAPIFHLLCLLGGADREVSLRGDPRAVGSEIGQGRGCPARRPPPPTRAPTQLHTHMHTPSGRGVKTGEPIQAPRALARAACPLGACIHATQPLSGTGIKKVVGGLRLSQDTVGLNERPNHF